MSLKAINWEFITDKQKINWDLSFIIVSLLEIKNRERNLNRHEQQILTIGHRPVLLPHSVASHDHATPRRALVGEQLDLRCPARRMALYRLLPDAQGLCADARDAN